MIDNLDINHGNDLCKGKLEKRRKTIYKALIKKLQEHGQSWIINIERDDGKTITCYSYHISEEYLDDENNWI